MKYVLRVIIILMASMAVINVDDDLKAEEADGL
jgi:hypothetical protein